MIDSDLERRLERMSADHADRPVDTDTAWRAFARLRGHRARNRRLISVAATATVVVAGAIVGSDVISHGTGRGSVEGGGKHQSARRSQLAITARISQPGAGRGPGDTGIAGTIVAQRGVIWGSTYANYLFRLDDRSRRVSFNEYVAGLRQIAAGGGAIWALTSSGAAHGRLIKIDPRSGQELAVYPLPRQCSQISYGGGQLWLACGSNAISFLRLDPANGQVLATEGSVHNVTYVVATSSGVWYGNDLGVSGYVGRGTQMRWVHTRDANNPVYLGNSDSLVYGQGYLWTFTNDEDVAKIDPATGRIVRIYGYQGYDPGYSLGLDFFTVGRNSLWFLADGQAQATGVLRVSMATGRPQGRIADAGSCGNPCWQIYYANGSVWVPTRLHITRIDVVSRPPRHKASR